MGDSPHNPAPAVGFLTIVEDELWGVLGGRLVLNAAGRPVEFYCTAPVKPSRAQQILYGPTLKPHLYAEQIAPALLEKSRTPQLFVAVDVDLCLPARTTAGPPLVLVGVAAEAARAGLFTFRLGDWPAAVLSHREEDAALVERRWREHLAGLDLLEPFGRIRDAMQEAQRFARPAA